MRSKIKEKLLEIDPHVYYGMVSDNVKLEDEWNYIVFGQDRMRKSGTSSIDLNGYWYVTIVREDFIPDEDVIKVLEKMSEVPGLRLADGDYQYQYFMKGSTNIVIEMLALQFTKSKKGVLSCLQ